METRTGTCHCGAVRFEVALEHGFNLACLDGVDPFAPVPIAIGDGAAQRPVTP